MDQPNPFDIVGTSSSCAPRNQATAPLHSAELPFMEADRNSAAILFAGWTWKHGWLVECVLHGAGYRDQCLPASDRDTHELNKEFCATNFCDLDEDLPPNSMPIRIETIHHFLQHYLNQRPKIPIDSIASSRPAAFDFPTEVYLPRSQTGVHDD